MVLESAELPQTPCCHFSLRLLEKNWKLSKKSLVCQLTPLLQTTYLDSCALVACHDLTFLKRKSVTQSPFICSFLDVLGFCLACSLAFLSRELSECALHIFRFRIAVWCVQTESATTKEAPALSARRKETCSIIYRT